MIKVYTSAYKIVIFCFALFIFFCNYRLEQYETRNHIMNSRKILFELQKTNLRVEKFELAMNRAMIIFQDSTDNFSQLKQNIGLGGNNYDEEF